MAKGKNDITAQVIANDKFCLIHESLVKSPQFQRLSPTAKTLYIYCRIQQSSGKAYATLKAMEQEQKLNLNANCFVFPKEHLKEYGLGQNNSTRYINELVAAGFIKIKYKNNNRWLPNIYEFIADWKTK